MSSQNKLQTTKCPIKIWREYAKSDPSATFFQTPEWYTITARHFGFAPHALLFQAGSEKAVLPLLHKKKIFQHFSCPLGTYTGLLAPDNLSEPFKSAITRFLGQLNIFLYVNPFSNNRFSLDEIQSMPTYIIQLDSLPVDPVNKTWKKGHRDNLRMAQKQGCEVREGTTDEDINFYHSIYLSTLKRWVKKSDLIYSKEFFWEIVNEGRNHNTAKLWLCEWQDKITAGMLCFYFNKHAVAWHACSDANHYGQYPNQLLLFQILTDARHRNFKFFDLNPSKNLEGVIKFKEGFGAVETNASITSHDNFFYGLAKKFRPEKQ